MAVIARIAILVFLLVLALPVVSQGLLTRIIDTGAGHASVTEITGESNSKHYLVYDTGSNARIVHDSVLSMIPRGDEIDLLVLSHSHEDHIAATTRILGSRSVRQILRTGCRGSNMWSNVDSAIVDAARSSNTTDINLRSQSISPGTVYNLGRATVTFLAGGGCGSDLNTSSIVVRLEYAGRSILFTGDAVGRHNDPLQNPGPIETEAELLSRHSQAGLSLNSDVIIAPHHGSDNASSTAFINAVDPEWVIFPAGHRYRHPRQSTAERYRNQGVPLKRILRTDRGDNEGRGDNPSSNMDDEWDYEATLTGDVVGDDDIDIIITEDGTLSVDYVN